MCWHCDNRDKDEDDYLREQIVPTIEQYGFCVQYISDEEDPDRKASLAYTIGLTERRLPELVVTGRKPEDAHGILNELAREWLVPGRLPPPGQRVLSRRGHVFEVVDVPEPDAHLFTAVNVYGRGVVRALQLAWSDRYGRWPWQPPCCAACPAQPVLGPRAPGAPRLVRLTAHPT